MVAELEGLKVLKKVQMGQMALTIKVSKDKLALYVDSTIVESSEKILIDRDSLVLMLKEVVSPKILSEGVLESIAAAAKTGKGLQDRKIATGTSPDHGLDGHLELLVKAVEIPAQNSDTRFIKDMQRVVPGMILGVIHPPTEGKSGIDVFGEEAKPKPGKPWKVPLDRSILQKPSMQEGGLEYLVAATYGTLVKDKDRLRVQNQLAIKADVDLTSGNVKFPGKFEVSGDVAKGFKVETRDDLDIRGRTHGSSLQTQLGGIRVDELVLGGPGIMVSSGMNFKAGMVQNLSVRADGDATIARDARDSSLKCNGVLMMKEGHLFGGEVSALGGVEVKIAGSDGGTRTLIACPTRDAVQAERDSLKPAIEEHVKMEELIAKKLGPFGDLASEKLPVLELPLARKINEVLLKRMDVKDAQQSLERKRERLSEALEREPWFQVNFVSLLHKGVVLKVGEDEFIIDHYRKGPGSITYSWQTRKFEEVKFKDLPALKPKAKPAT